MTDLKKLPDPEKVKRTVERLRASNQQLEAVTLALDELIAIVEADIRHTPLTAYCIDQYECIPSQESVK
ncbi:hypothetical protein [Chroococcidiopsis sp. CCMEE 29]|uniref:hypothetical protein n=1 Tax=Chroococcidiopsis sp. CCMEE 29 TaxID=155894 RepID=UPI002020418B|nr:hypothetical protein [Chroococcidiopsis sp. CCMEE 29]